MNLKRNIKGFRKLVYLSFLIFIVVLVLQSDLFINYIVVSSDYVDIDKDNSSEDDLEHDMIVKIFYNQRRDWITSNLGAILFKNEKPSSFQISEKQKKTFTILVWRYWDWLKKRHLNRNGDLYNVLEGCAVQNCKFVEDDSLINDADAVVIHTQKCLLPKVSKRNQRSRWIFLNDEAPGHTFSLSKGRCELEDMAGVFNWTMTYRSDSDIPVPYGRTVPLKNPLKISFSDTYSALKALVPFWDKKTNLARSMVLMSNCVTFRLRFIKDLQEFFEVDIFGRCSDIKENKNACPGHFFEDCLLPASYLFYLVLENANCREYLTEKIFQHAYSKGAIPVIMGPSLKDCEQLLPPHSYLHVSNYKTIKHLAEEMTNITKSQEKILKMHSWRKHFRVFGEHGYFKTKSYHYCRVCEALNFNDDESKVYNLDDLRQYFDEEALCDSSYGEKTQV